MGTTERSKKRVQLWKKAAVHFALCFVMGFFTGFAPTFKRSILSKSATEVELEPPQQLENVNSSLIAETHIVASRPDENYDESERRMSEDEEQVSTEINLIQRKFIIIVTPTSTKNLFKTVLLRRLANTIKLVPPPLLWIVVEAKTESNIEVSRVLRKTGVMYRHLVFKENFTDTEAEMDHQRNVALKHIEQHKLSGIVHFAGLSNVYDLGFFDQLREIEVFGTWPLALLAANRKKVIIEGPVCDSSQVIGWHILRKMNSTDQTDESNRLGIHISSFAFNSSILWDPERWGRTSSLQSTSQNSMKFVRQVVLEDETKLKGIPPDDCSKIMLWSLRYQN